MEHQIRSLGVITSEGHERALREALSGASVVDEWRVGEENPDLTGILGSFFDRGASTVVIDAAGLPYRDVSDRDLVDWVARNPESPMRIVYISDAAAQRDDEFVNKLVAAGVHRIVMLRYAASPAEVGDEVVGLALSEPDEAQARGRLAALPEPGKSGRLAKLIPGRKVEEAPDVLEALEEEEDESSSGPEMSEVEWMSERYGAVVPEDVIAEEKEKLMAEKEPRIEEPTTSEAVKDFTEPAAKGGQGASTLLSSIAKAASANELDGDQLKDLAGLLAILGDKVKAAEGASATTAAEKTPVEEAPAPTVKDIEAEASTNPLADEGTAVPGGTGTAAQDAQPAKVEPMKVEPAPQAAQTPAPTLEVAQPEVRTIAVCGVVPGSGTTHLAIASAVHLSQRYRESKVVMLLTDPRDLGRIRPLLNEHNKPKGSDVEFRLAKNGAWPLDCDIAVADCGVLAVDTQSRAHSMFSTASEKLVTVGGEPWNDLGPLASALRGLTPSEFTSLRWCTYGASTAAVMLLRSFCERNGITEGQFARARFDVSPSRTDILMDPGYDESMLALFPKRKRSAKGKKARSGQRTADRRTEE